MLYNYATIVDKIIKIEYQKQNNAVACRKKEYFIERVSNCGCFIVSIFVYEYFTIGSNAELTR